MMDAHEWVQRLQDGEDDAWQEFIRSYARFVPIVSRKLGLSETDREEVLQEVMLTAYRSIRNLREPERLSSWVYTITRRAAISQWKSRRRNQIDSIDDDPEVDRLPSGELPIDQVLVDSESLAKLRTAVAALKAGCRNLIEDLFLREPRLSYKDVSETRGMPLGSIGPTLARCLETLRREWKSVSKGA